MDAYPPEETIELDGDRFISLSFDRSWPKFVVSWSVRQREGETDFPVAGGAAESLPVEGKVPGKIWEDLREDALRQAHEVQSRELPAEPRKGFFSRIRGR